jgi:hypothetical protein
VVSPELVLAWKQGEVELEIDGRAGHRTSVQRGM